MSIYFRINKRTSSSWLLSVFLPFISVLLALIGGSIFLSFLKVSPIQAYRGMFQTAFGDWYGISETIVKAIPLILSGIAVTLAFKATVWNIGAAGQIFLGALATTAAVRYFYVDNRGIMLVIMFLFAGIAGGGWAAIAGYLKARWNVNETITTLMLNYIAIHLADYFIYGPWKDPDSLGFPMTAPFPEAARLPQFAGTRIHYGLFIAIIFAILFWFIFRYTRWGYEIRVIGENPKAAQYAGIYYLRYIVLIMFISGAIAGIAGMGEVSGLQGRLQHGFTAEFGFTAIIVAWLARLNPISVMLVSFLIGALQVGGESLQIVMRLPIASTLVLQGLILFFVLGGEFFRNYRIRFIRGDEH